MTGYGNACSSFNDQQIAELRGIGETYLDSGNIVVKLSNLLGNAVEDVMEKVPEGIRHGLDNVADLALRSAYLAAASTQADKDSESYVNQALAWCSGERFHKIAAGVSGLIGGAGGLATTAADLAATTVLIMRSIQEIAAGYGENIETESVRLQCLVVFGFGGPLTEDDEVETGLYGVRIAAAQTLEKVIIAVLPRFGILASEKAMAQAVPIIGAAVGATINPIFTDYYQQMAHVHFRLRRLEARHDPDQVNACFERIVRALREERGARSRKKK